MSIDIKVPPLPESVSEATVVTWHKQPGDAVSRDENLVDIETDKVVLEVPAPADGVLGEIQAGEGDTVMADQVIGSLDDQAKAGGGEQAQPSAPAKEEQEPAPEPAKAPEAEPAKPAAGASAAVDESELSPAVRRLVAENDLDPAAIPATGPGGRITKEDVLNYMESAGAAGPTTEPSQPPTPPARDPSREAKEAEPEPLGSAAAGAAERPERRVPMTRLRQRIAERLVEAQQTAAMLTTFNEVNMKPVMDLRARYKEQFEKTHGVKLGFMSFFVKAACEALKRYPAVNASIDGTDIIYHGYQDIGIAVSTDRGLVVPVLRDADHQSYADIESNIVDFGKRARDGKLTMDELTGGTFSITNGGIFGSLLSTPILNPPQSAILGMHKTQERPVVENGEIVIRPMMYLALSYDHRIIDGKEAVSFLVALKECIEDPARLLLEV
ncbi:2-oxoglutarate dehydrogenase complex dihydrolipoyllysine-residue succinyltransferase [Aquisalimonas lutea]|uniref:2-oxoglutarate dehydrogenase complex dihydrolipoyllysine-residue succinyltransferase n=1 Tax=Aquisalimonas lutea TaxID=1327750 RepID=UPI0025B52FFC|nr:2-oxoglutarate dehydrogenase complex dihydrolipoyllysine-residue succinyltransferase [Aquisalimonas lutea]MDN3516718.1 2-oxoglutarate dehydrogenase complex dihydrolipoyllysine-residue succinyltransferase [Aquisalimonas lutea]